RPACPAQHQRPVFQGHPAAASADSGGANRGRLVARPAGNHAGHPVSHASQPHRHGQLYHGQGPGRQRATGGQYRRPKHAVVGANTQWRALFASAVSVNLEKVANANRNLRERTGNEPTSGTPVTLLAFHRKELNDAVTRLLYDGSSDQSTITWNNCTPNSTFNIEGIKHVRTPDHQGQA